MSQTRQNSSAEVIGGVEIRQFTAEELDVLRALAAELERTFPSAESDAFADAVSQAALRLPATLRTRARQFQLGQGPRAIRFSGLDLDEPNLMATPNSWDHRWEEPGIIHWEICHALIASLFGEIFGWHTQENGRFFRHIIPHPRDAYEQLGSGSAVTLEWHNEEAFHPSRADSIVMMCFRNFEGAVTTVCPSSALELDDSVRAILRQPRFVIVPDKSHRVEFNQSSHWSLSDEDFKRIESMLTKPEPIAVVTGAGACPFVRLDPAFMHAIDDEAKRALAILAEEVDKKMTHVVLESGDFMIVDNLRAVHGRSAYRPNYGPRQRWLRRVNVAMDLFKGGQNYVAGCKRRFI